MSSILHLEILQACISNAILDTTTAELLDTMGMPLCAVVHSGVQEHGRTYFSMRLVIPKQSRCTSLQAAVPSSAPCLCV